MFAIADAVDGYDPSLIMDGSPDLYDERLMYNGGAGAGRYGYPSVPARLVLIHHFVYYLLINMVINAVFASTTFGMDTVFTMVCPLSPPYPPSLK